MGVTQDDMALTATARQFVRFAAVGCLNVAVSFVVFYALYRVWPIATLVLDNLGSFSSTLESRMTQYGVRTPDASLASVVGYVAGMLNSFALNKIWTFRATGNATSQLRRFLALNALGLALSTLIVFVFVDLLRGPYVLVWFSAIAIVMILNFLGQKHWAFSDGISARASR